MSKFSNKGKKRTPGITTAALPDIVFMLLFFFMVATHERDTDAIVQLKIPTAKEATVIEDKTITAYINIGKPTAALQTQFGKETRIQLNDAIKELKDIPQFIEQKRDHIKGKYPDPDIAEKKVKKMTVCLKVDKDSKNGYIDDVKQSLRKVNALRIRYIVNNVGGGN